ncbi:hypothetical protein GOP47_0009152 [Adiantum capillus-veneris]|uniref:Uncharacterized protein n=1 Tax=Adiantum capillus-veneris TaxID=13818 RepID=A0A9D4UW80_ADICA|nr:hypothetical protein GOP47_0009152 [Adiantum capillus-veneris]
MERLEEMKEHFHWPTKQFMPALQAAGKSEAAAILLEISSVSSSSDNELIESLDDEDMGDSECSLSEWRAISCFNLGFDVNTFAQALPTWDSKVEEMLEQANIHWQRHLVMGILKRVKNVDVLWPFFHWLKNKVGYKHDSYSRSEGMKFTVPMFNRVMRYYVGTGEGDRVFRFKLITEVGLEPNRISYNSRSVPAQIVDALQT